MQRIVALILLVILSPFFAWLFILHKFYGKGSFLFKQLRVGKGKKTFYIYKIRTMIPEAEKIKSEIAHLNEADGPVFKIKNDPRFTRLGKILSRMGLDELPQLINIIKGDMEFVGPRPLPVEEAEQIPKKYSKRFSVKPGITSPWVIEGAFHNNFDRWMRLDLAYVQEKSFFYDLKIFFLSILLVCRLIMRSLKEEVFKKLLIKRG